MKQLLITIAALVLVGCGKSVPAISIYDAAEKGDITAIEKHIVAGTNVNGHRKGKGITYYVSNTVHCIQCLFSNPMNRGVGSVSVSSRMRFPRGLESLHAFFTTKTPRPVDEYCVCILNPLTRRNMTPPCDIFKHHHTIISSYLPIIIS